MVDTTFLKKSLLACLATAPLALTPSCTEEQKAYRLDVMQKETGRVAWFKICSNADEPQDTLYYRVKTYQREGGNWLLLSNQSYAAPVQTKNPESKEHIVHLYKHVLRQESSNGQSTLDRLIIEFYPMGIVANTVLPQPLDIEIRPEHMPLYEKDREVEAAKHRQKQENKK